MKEDVFNGQERRAAHIIRGLTCQSRRPTYLVVDHFHRLTGIVPPLLVSALMTHSCRYLRVVFAGCGLEIAFIKWFRAHPVNWIGREVLKYTWEDILERFRTGGIPLSDTQAKELYENTHGWAKAVETYFQAAQAGVPTQELSLEQVLGRQMFEKLMPRQQERLVHLAGLDEVSEGDLRQLWRVKSLTKEDYTLLSKVPLLQLDPEAGLFRLPSTLSHFFRLRLQHAPEPVRQKVHLAIAGLCALRDDLVGAIAHYYAVKDYGAILSLDLKCLHYTLIEGIPFHIIVREILDNASPDLLRAHPISVLRMAFHLFGAGDYPRYDRALKRAHSMMNPEEDPHLYGEWLMISLWGEFPNLDKMHAALREAMGWLQEPVRAIAKEEPFLFCCPSMWYAFYASPGEGEQIAHALDIFMADYVRVMGGGRFGAVHLYRGELASMQMRLSEAETLAHTAISLAQRERIPGTIAGAALLLARIAILRRDAEGTRAALRMLSEDNAAVPSCFHTPMGKSVRQSVRSIIRSLANGVGLNLPGEDPPVKLLQDNSMLAQLLSHSRVVDMFVQGDYKAASGHLEAVLALGEKSNTAALLIAHAILAPVWLLTGRRDKGIQALDEALQLAEPDRLMSIMVNHARVLKGVADAPELRAHAPFLKDVIARAQALWDQAAEDQARELRRGYAVMLTPRELEVARLAGQGSYNREIAEQLGVTENTVKKHIQSIFRKLGIGRRAQLAEKLQYLDSP